MVGCDRREARCKLCGMRPLRRFGPRLLISAGLLCAGPAPAEESPRSVAGKVEDGISAHVRKGRMACNAGSWKEAEAAFNAALVAGGSAPMTPAARAEIIGELGLCELKQRRYRDGAEHIEESLSLGRGALGASLRRRLEEGQRIAEKHIARVYLTVVPSDAEVLIDGKVIQRRQAAHELFLDPGPHKLRARMDGYDDFEASFKVVAGDAPPLRAVLARARTAPPVARRAPAAPATPAAPAEPGDGSASTWRTLGIVASAVTAAGGVAVLIGEEALNSAIKEKSAETKKRSGPVACQGATRADSCAQLADAERERVTLAWIGVSSLVASGVVAALTVASFLSPPAQKAPVRQAGVRVVPVVGQSSGLLVHGSF